MKVVLLSLICFLTCAATPLQSREGLSARKNQPLVHASSLEKNIHLLINDERRLHGLPLLGWSPELAGIAKNHSKDMSERKYFDHISPEGHNFLYRYKLARYDCSVRVGRTIYMGAENIALNYLYNSVTTMNGQAHYDWNSQDKIAEDIVEGWMKSPGHKRNILSPYFSHEGIGVSISPDDKIYITQNFC